VSSDDRQPQRDALKQVAAALKTAEVPFALAGGYAAWARGGPESEHDVDFFVAEEDLDRAVKALEEAGLPVEQPPEDWLVKARAGDELVDIIFRPNDRPVTPKLLARADELRVAALAMPVLAATDLMLTKLLAMSEHYCDLSALLPTARALREQVDWERVRRETTDSPFAAGFLVVAERLGIVPAEGGQA
jgi:hypothetical protein